MLRSSQRFRVRTRQANSIQQSDQKAQEGQVSWHQSRTRVQRSINRTEYRTHRCIRRDSTWMYVRRLPCLRVYLPNYFSRQDRPNSIVGWRPSWEQQRRKIWPMQYVVDSHSIVGRSKSQERLSRVSCAEEINWGGNGLRQEQCWQT